jgi:hypothetical protein
MYANTLAVDDDFVYLVNEFAAIVRVPKSGGMPEELAEPLYDWLPFSMEVDDTTIYLGAIPVDGIFTPLPGVILSVPKTGGVVSVLASGAESPFALALDEEHVYWAAAGILDFSEGELQPGGKIERVRKDGSERRVLAGSLSAPLALVLDGNDVYYGESGLTSGDSSIGLFRVAKTGGAVTTIRGDVLVAGLALDGDTLAIGGETDEDGVGIFALAKQGGAPRQLVSDDSIGFALRAAGRRAYYVGEHDETELMSVSIDVPSAPRVVRTGIDGDAFVLDGCAVIVNTVEGNLIRTPR